jgi:hypothetical protein
MAEHYGWRTSAQRVEQRLGVLEAGGIEALKQPYTGARRS